MMPAEILNFLVCARHQFANILYMLSNNCFWLAAHKSPFIISEKQNEADVMN